METIFITITGVNHYYGLKPFKVGSVVKLVKDKTNGFDNEEGVLSALNKVISAKHSDMLEVNLNAMRIGRDY